MRRSGQISGNKIPPPQQQKPAAELAATTSCQQQKSAVSNNQLSATKTSCQQQPAVSTKQPSRVGTGHKIRLEGGPFGARYRCQFVIEIAWRPNRRCQFVIEIACRLELTPTRRRYCSHGLSRGLLSNMSASPTGSVPSTRKWVAVIRRPEHAPVNKTGGEERLRKGSFRRPIRTIGV